jgi:hypothetical protein
LLLLRFLVIIIFCEQFSVVLLDHSTQQHEARQLMGAVLVFILAELKLLAVFAAIFTLLILRQIFLCLLSAELLLLFVVVPECQGVAIFY